MEGSKAALRDWPSPADAIMFRATPTPGARWNRPRTTAIAMIEIGRFSMIVYREILATGRVIFSNHALDEMEQDAITQTDAIRVLRSGTVDPAEFERGSWRYRVRAQNLYVVATFRSDVLAVVVTAWKTAR